MSNTWFLGPTRVYPLIGISIGSAVFGGLTNVTNRQTDRQRNTQTDHAIRLYQYAASSYCCDAA